MRTGRSLTVCWRLLPGGGVYLPGLGGVCLVQGGLPGRGGGLPGLVGEGSLPGPGGSACSWGGGLASQHALRQTTPPVDRITDACKNITLAQLRCGR